MTRNPSVTIVVPCYDEAGRLQLSRFAAYAERRPGVRFLFVDDGSTDETGKVLARFQSAHPEACRLVSLPENRGKAEAVRVGLREAFLAGADYAGFMDADLSTPLDAIDEFLRVMREQPGVDVVIGARVRLLGRTIVRRPVRHYLGRVFATAASLVLGLPVYDTQCGAKLFRATPEISGLFEAPFATRWLFDVEIFARLLLSRGAGAFAGEESFVFEYPLREWRHVSGSKVRPGDFARAAVDLLVIHFRYRARRPVGTRADTGRRELEPVAVAAPLR